MMEVAEFLKPVAVMAREKSRKSECVRRQYGAAIVHKNGKQVYGYNQRVTRCCGALHQDCARDRFSNQPGQNSDIGAEIHAEQAVLLDWGKKSTKDWFFVLTGSSGERNLYGTANYPCYSCARMIKYVGFRNIFVEDKGGKIIPVSIEEIIEYREQEWDNVVNA